MNVIFNSKSDLELIEKHALEEAKKVADNTDNTKTQIRRFYQEYVTIMSSLESCSEDDFKSILLRIKMLIPKAEYSKSRKMCSFYDWLIDNLKAIKTQEDASRFMCYFEAYVGYFYSEVSKPQANNNQFDRRRR